MELQNRFSQEKLRPHVDARTSAKMFTLELAQYGPYKLDYTREGKHLLLGGRKGHLAVLDWQTHKLLTELNVDETVRDVKCVPDGRPTSSLHLFPGSLQPKLWRVEHTSHPFSLLLPLPIAPAPVLTGSFTATTCSPWPRNLAFTSTIRSQFSSLKLRPFVN